MRHSCEAFYTVQHVLPQHGYEPVSCQFICLLDTQKIGALALTQQTRSRETNWGYSSYLWFPVVIKALLPHSPINPIFQLHPNLYPYRTSSALYTVWVYSILSPVALSTFPHVQELTSHLVTFQQAVTWFWLPPPGLTRLLLVVCTCVSLL